MTAWLRRFDCELKASKLLSVMLRELENPLMSKLPYCIRPDEPIESTATTEVAEDAYIAEQAYFYALP